MQLKMFTVVPNHKFQQVRKGPITTISEKKQKRKELSNAQFRGRLRASPQIIHSCSLTRPPLLNAFSSCLKKLDGTSPSHLGSIPPILLISPLLSFGRHLGLSFTLFT